MVLDSSISIPRILLLESSLCGPVHWREVAPAPVSQFEISERERENLQEIRYTAILWWTIQRLPYKNTENTKKDPLDRSLLHFMLSCSLDTIQLHVFLKVFRSIVSMEQGWLLLGGKTIRKQEEWNVFNSQSRQGIEILCRRRDIQLLYFPLPIK